MDVKERSPLDYPLALEKGAFTDGQIAVSAQGPGDSFADLNVYEKKSFLVNRAMDSIGFGCASMTSLFIWRFKVSHGQALPVLHLLPLWLWLLVGLGFCSAARLDPHSSGSRMGCASDRVRLLSSSSPV
jgi:hypothetical protein